MFQDYEIRGLFNSILGKANANALGRLKSPKRLNKCDNKGPD